MNMTETLISPECAAITTQPQNTLVKSIKFPNQPQEWKIISLRECPTPEEMQQCETPEQAAAYWRTHVGQHPYFKIDVHTTANGSGSELRFLLRCWIVSITCCDGGS
jgi:hypothetical protein